jgi:hypothetical protein
MRLLKAKEAAPAAPVTRAEFDALTRRFDAFQRIAAIGYMAAEESAKYPGVSGGPGSAHLRLEKIAAVASDLFGLDAAEVRELRGFLRLVQAARGAESNREAAEIRARDNLQRNPWLPDGTYGRRIPGT